MLGNVDDRGGGFAIEGDQTEEFISKISSKPFCRDDGCIYRYDTRDIRFVHQPLEQRASNFCQPFA